eukprot:scaffold3540_cov147-Isochrysis_galbana.AAC.11
MTDAPGTGQSQTDQRSTDQPDAPYQLTTNRASLAVARTTSSMRRLAATCFRRCQGVAAHPLPCHFGVDTAVAAPVSKLPRRRTVGFYPIVRTAMK